MLIPFIYPCSLTKVLLGSLPIQNWLKIMKSVESKRTWRPPYLVKAHREVEEMRHMRLPFGQVSISIVPSLSLGTCLRLYLKQFWYKVVSLFDPILSATFDFDSDEAR